MNRKINDKVELEIILNDEQINSVLNEAVNNKNDGQIRLSLNQAIYLLNNGYSGDSNPSIMREDINCDGDDSECNGECDKCNSPMFHGIYQDDIESLDDCDNIQLWFYEKQPLECEIKIFIVQEESEGIPQDTEIFYSEAEAKTRCVSIVNNIHNKTFEDFETAEKYASDNWHDSGFRLFYESVKIG